MDLDATTTADTGGDVACLTTCREVLRRARAVLLQVHTVTYQGSGGDLADLFGEIGELALAADAAR